MNTQYIKIVKNKLRYLNYGLRTYNPFFAQSVTVEATNEEQLIFRVASLDDRDVTIPRKERRMYAFSKSFDFEIEDGEYAIEYSNEDELVLDLKHKVTIVPDSLIKKIKEAEKLLKANGYHIQFTDYDVSNTHECTREQAMSVLDTVFNDEYLSGEINERITHYSDKMGLKEKEENEHF